jgi:hypothetical protein
MTDYSILGQHGMIASAGCLGSRVYNELGDDGLYVVFPTACCRDLWMR